MTKGVRRGSGLFLLWLFCLSILSAPALSQAPDAARSAHASPHRYRPQRIDDQVKGFAKALDLNDEQQAAVKKILERRQQEIVRIMRNGSGSDGIDHLRALQTATAEQIRSVLNDEQKKKYNALMPHPPQTTQQPSVEDWMKATRPH